MHIARWSMVAACAFALSSAALTHSALGAPIAVPDDAGVRAIGPLDVRTPVHFALNLRYEHATELERFVDTIADKRSQQYGAYLDNAAWNAYFAPSQATLITVGAALLRAGFRIESIAPNRGVVDVVGDPATVGRYFGTTLERVVQPGVGIRYRNARAAKLPAELAPYVTSVSGLSNLRLVRRPLRGVMHRGHALAFVAGQPTNGPDGGYGPVALSVGYDYPAVHGSTGRGRTLGVTIAGDVADGDLRQYLRYFNIKRTGRIERIPVDGGSAAVGDVETTLDAETIAGLAPGADLRIYEFPDFVAKDINDTLNRVVADNAVDAFSNSWGYCERVVKSLGLWDPQQLHAYFLQAEAKGITPIYASGDEGAFTRGCNATLAVSNPASDPNVVAVGGTSFSEFDGRRLVDESAWTGSGGGVSTVFAEPAYQAGVIHASTKGRNIPDVALPANVEDSIYDASNGGWFTVGGTSWAAPAFNALVGELVQVRGHRLGFLNPALYVARTRGQTPGYRDIIYGNDGFYSAGAGYDYLTGLGVPIGSVLAGDL